MQYRHNYDDQHAPHVFSAHFFALVSHAMVMVITCLSLLLAVTALSSMCVCL